mmetsp:Transcript_47211/g.122018  ORF Transcript_47211/g.122018 Transcript_47211/m.122018 type:complete len:350 (+) Transcript_47211:2-1051(+)
MGSDHRMLWIHLSGCSGRGRLMFFRSFTFQRPSPMPPCTTSTRSAMTAPSGSWSKAFWMTSKTCWPQSLPKRSWHSCWKPYFWFMSRSSWLPRTSQTRSGSRTLSASSRPMVSSWCSPRSTKSPLKTNMGAFRSAGLPKAMKNNIRSRNCPWMSPKTLQGAETSATGGCAASILQAARAMRISVSKYSVLKRWTRTSGSSHSQSSLSIFSTSIFWARWRARITTTFARSRTRFSIVPVVWEVAPTLYLVLCTALSVIALKSSTCVCMSFPARTPQCETASGFFSVSAFMNWPTPPGRPEPACFTRFAFAPDEAADDWLLLEELLEASSSSRALWWKTPEFILRTNVDWV